MAEFGHLAITAPCVHIDAWGAGPFTIVDERGKEWFFEDSERFGPSLVSRSTHEILARQPRERSKFWRAHSLWVAQGRRVDDGRCLWDEPCPACQGRGHIHRRPRGVEIFHTGGADVQQPCIACDSTGRAANLEPRDG